MRLSIVVVLVDGGGQLDRCLSALASQRAPGDLEVIVPWDESVSGIDSFVRRFPGPTFRFPAIGQIRTSQPPTSHAGLHELYDHRRTAGLRAATGDIVAMIEDRSVPVDGWAEALRRLHAQRPNGVIGGALASGRHGILGLADYLCDFYRFQPPFEAGPRDWVSYVNISYKRDALERTRSIWTETYHDLAVNRALMDGGEQLWLSPELLVKQERGDGTRLATLIEERFAWGRRFAVYRLRANAGRGRARFATQSLLVPLVLWLRAIRAQRTPAAVGRALLATPAMFLIFAAWGLGELVGSVTGRQ